MIDPSVLHRSLFVMTGRLSICCLAASGQSSDTTAVDAATACSQRQLEAWAFVQQRSQGIAARDPVGSKIGRYPAKPPE